MTWSHKTFVCDFLQKCLCYDSHQHDPKNLHYIIVPSKALTNIFNQLILLLNQWQAKDDTDEIYKLSLSCKDWMGILHSSFKNLSTQFFVHNW